MRVEGPAARWIRRCENLPHPGLYCPSVLKRTIAHPPLAVQQGRARKVNRHETISCLFMFTGAGRIQEPRVRNHLALMEARQVQTLSQNVKAGFQTHSSSFGFEHFSHMKHFHLFTPAVSHHTWVTWTWPLTSVCLRFSRTSSRGRTSTRSSTWTGWDTRTCCSSSEPRKEEATWTWSSGSSPPTTRRCWTHEELQPNELNSVYLKFTTFIFLFSMLYIFQNVFNSFYYYLINILLFIKIKLM